MLKIKKITLTPMITGVAPGATYNPTVDLLFDDENDPTIKVAAVRAQLAAMTDRLPVVTFEREAVAV
jgi:hypothetical protein